MKYTNDAWMITLPGQWSTEEAEDCISFYSPDESRSLHVSDYFKEEGVVTLEDIRELAELSDFEKTNLPFLEGVHYRDATGDELILSWWLYLENHLIFAEYICPHDKEQTLAQEIETLVFSIQSIHSS